MTFSFAVIFAASLLIPIAASAQMYVPEPQTQEAVPAILALTKSSRAGITTDRITNSRGVADPDTARSHVSAGTYIGHAIVGGLVGVVSGAAIGAAIGAYKDRHSRSNGDDIMIPMVAVLGVVGAAAGLVLGLIIGAGWPTA
jgi:hypothetical protein